MKINLMSEQNVNSVKEIEDECLSNPWSLQSFVNELSKVGAYFYVAEECGEALGYIGFNTVLDEGYIANVAVKKNHRGKGIAKLLLNKVIEKAKEVNLSFVTLEVRKSNEIAIGLYKSYGFEVQGARKNFYRNPQEDGLIMTKFL
jgi:ribosomal-protein-alanine N-acetyltransferase